MSADNQKRLANDFTRTAWGIRAGQTFTVQSLHEMIQADDPEIQGPEDYSEHLRIAIQDNLIQPVPGKPDTYRLMKWKHPKRYYYELYHRILCALGDQDSLQRVRQFLREGRHMKGSRFSDA